MKKRMIKALLAIGTAVCVGLCGCAKDGDGDKDRNSRQEEEDDEDEDDEDDDDEDDDDRQEPSSQPPVDDDRPVDPVAEEAEAIYREKLLELCDSLSDMDAALMAGEEDLYWLPDFRYVVDQVGDSPLDLVGYAIEDLSGDGVPELILASEALTEDDLGMNIHNIYTIKDGECVLVVQGWARNRQYLLRSGLLLNEGSSGAMSSCHGVYRLSKDGTEQEWEEFYFSEADAATGQMVFFLNQSGEWDPSVSEKLKINEEQFWEIREEYEKLICDIPLTFLSEVCE